jgi:hypothetical protein
MSEHDAALVLSVLSMHVRAQVGGDVTTADPHAVLRIADRLRQMIQDRGWTTDPSRQVRELQRYGLDESA